MRQDVGKVEVLVGDLAQGRAQLGGQSSQKALQALLAGRRGFAAVNPCKQVDKPERPGATPDVQFLDAPELDALLAAVPQDERGPTERTIYLTAAMASLRQGELVGLRWRDIDWPAGRLRLPELCSRRVRQPQVVALEPLHAAGRRGRRRVRASVVSSSHSGHTTPGVMVEARVGR